MIAQTTAIASMFKTQRLKLFGKIISTAIILKS